MTPFEGLGGVVFPEAVVVGELHLVVAGAIEDHLLRLFRQLRPRRVEGEAVVPGQRVEGLQVIGRGRLAPRRDGVPAERQGMIGDDEGGVDHALGAEAVADRAGAVGVVEGKQPRLDLGNGEAGDRAGELFGEDDAGGEVFFLPGRACGAPRLLGVTPLPVPPPQGGRGRGVCVCDVSGCVARRRGGFRTGAATLLPPPLRGRVGEGGPPRGGGHIRKLGDGDAVGELQRGLEGVGEAGGDVGPHHDAVDHHLDVVLELLVEGRRLGDLVELAVDLHPLEAALHQLGQLLAVLALAAADDRGEQVEARALGQRQHPVDHLRDRLALDRQAGRRRVGDADPGEEEPHVVVDLGDRADGGARVAAGGLLLDGDGRRQAVDLVDIRLLHHLEELAGVGRQALDVAALALGIDGVEGERRLAGARQAGEHHQAVARQVEVDVLEIVLARPADRDELARGGLGLGHGASYPKEARRGPPPKLKLLAARDKRRGRIVPTVRAGC